MMLSLKTKLSGSFILLTMLCVVSISILANFFLETQFRKYIMDKQEELNQEIVSRLGKEYESHGNWDLKSVENIGISALEQGLILKMTDTTKKVVWDATVHNNGLCETMISHMTQNMHSRYPNWDGAYVEKKYPVLQDKKEIASVDIGYYGPFYFTDADLAFINTLNKLLLLVGTIALFLSLFLGISISNRLTNPLRRIIQAAKKISKGDYQSRVALSTTTKEIHVLAQTVNELSLALENQENLRKRLTADVAHELRTPLATLQGNMEGMIDDILQTDKKRLSSCNEEIQRIIRLVGNLELLARVEGPELSLEKKEFNLTQLVCSTVETYRPVMEEKNIRAELPTETITITADEDKIRQVVLNLLSNAVKFSEPHSVVSISLLRAPSDKEITLIVKDTGIGIPEEDLPFIFERFYRADKSRNRLTGGTGLGLAIVKAIVTAHNGSIHAKSTFNKGSEFIVKLPVR